MEDEDSATSAKALDRVRAITPQIVAVGSRVTCNPSPEGTDADYLIHLLDYQANQFWQTIKDDGWKLGGSVIQEEVNRVPPEDRFYSFRMGDVNLIVTRSRSFTHRFLAATSIAKRLNLLDKADRIALFQAVLYGRIDAEVPALHLEEAF